MKGKPTILVVDNEATFCTAVGDTLCANGYKIKTVDNRADARRAISAMSPDLVVLGCIAPRGDAFALHQWIRSTRPYSSIPIVVIDVPVEKQLLAGWRKSEGMSLDADEYLVKPLEPASLLPRIAKLLDKTTSRVKVLVVDDHALVREGICALLSLQRDIQVVGVAENGKEALQMVEELDPDVVLMDLRMPEMNGLEFLQALKGGGDNTKFGFVTSEGTPEMVQTAEENGALFLISKPFTADTFKEKLQPVL